jgi:glycosyltransferase involved in cell wall biosynthesis
MFPPITLMRPRVSVIIPSYNAANFISQAISSCLAQTIKDFEVVVVDDASNDATAALVESTGDSRVRLYRNGQNLGPGLSRNMGLRSARGEWLTFLDADDCYSHLRLEILLSVAEMNGPKYVYSDDWVGWAESQAPSKLMRQATVGSISSHRVRLEDWLEKSREARIFFHRSALETMIEWFPSTRVGEDTVFTARLLKSVGTPLIRVDSRSYIYRNTPGSLTKSKSKLPGALESNKSYRLICEEVLEGRHPAGLLLRMSHDDVQLKQLKAAIEELDVRRAVFTILRKPRTLRTIALRAYARVRRSWRR